MTDSGTWPRFRPSLLGSAGLGCLRGRKSSLYSQAGGPTRGLLEDVTGASRSSRWWILVSGPREETRELQVGVVVVVRRGASGLVSRRGARVTDASDKCCHSLTADARWLRLRLRERLAPCDECLGLPRLFISALALSPALIHQPTSPATLMKPAAEARSCRRPVRAELPTKGVRRFLLGARLARRLTIGCARAVFGCRGRW